MKVFRVPRTARWALALVILLGAASLFVPRVVAALYAWDSITTVEDAPHRRVTIVFGARVLPDGRLSRMLADRVATGVALYHAGKTDVLLLTGDNSVAHYNEPEAMRRYARERGVPDEALVLDYAGFRTYDSCYRAREIFQVDEAILVTQAFHLDRALLTCNALGIDAVGVPADLHRPEAYRFSSLLFSHLRELPATTVAVLDLLRRPRPVLGDPLPIRLPDASPRSSAGPSSLLN